MKIISIGHDFRHPGDFYISRPSGLNEHLLLVIRSTALFKINGQCLHISPNSMILIKKNTPHFFSADSDLFINDWIALSFNEKDCLQYNENSIKFNTFFTSPDVAICSKIIELIQSEKNSGSIFRDNNITAMLQIIFNKLQDNSVYYTNQKYYNELQKIRSEIYSHPTQKFTVEQLASKAYMSKSYFQACYKSAFGTSPIADVINSRIEYSKQLLLSTNFSVSKIAEAIGYANDIQFIKQFKSVVQTTPKNYRSKVLAGTIK